MEIASSSRLHAEEEEQARKRPCFFGLFRGGKDAREEDRGKRKRRKRLAAERSSPSVEARMPARRQRPRRPALRGGRRAAFWRQGAREEAISACTEATTDACGGGLFGRSRASPRVIPPSVDRWFRQALLGSSALRRESSNRSARRRPLVPEKASRRRPSPKSPMSTRSSGVAKCAHERGIPRAETPPPSPPRANLLMVRSLAATRAPRVAARALLVRDFSAFACRRHASRPPVVLSLARALERRFRRPRPRAVARAASS